MVRQSLPRVLDDQLMLPDRADQSFLAIQVGSEAWYAWLDEPATRSFAFHSPQGTLTARREHRYATWYWYAYRFREGHLHKIYLGKSKELTLLRLHTAATLLSAESATSPQPHSALPPLQPAAVTPLSSATGLPPLHLLTTKITVPPARPYMMLRPRLTQRMHAAMRGPLTLIAAPAGWGKTTLLHAWHADASRKHWPLAWVSLDAGDNDPLRFWTYVISTLNSLHPGVARSPWRCCTPRCPTDRGRARAPAQGCAQDFCKPKARVVESALGKEPPRTMKGESSGCKTSLIDDGRSWRKKC